MWKKILAVLFGVVIGYWFYDDFDPDKLKGKRVVITGASAGIGEQIAYHYARFGANVVVTARRGNVLQEVVKKCREVGTPQGRYEYVIADMSNLTSTQYVIREAVRLLGGIDVLVLNHIMPFPLGEWHGSHENLTQLSKIMDINFRAYVHLSSHAQTHLEKSHGSIVVVSSYAGKIAVPFVAPYVASKFALDGFFSTLRQELRLRNCDISVTLCVIGLVGTESALNQLRVFGQNFLLSTLYIASPTDTALAIVKGGARRSREMYYPYMEVRLPYLLRDWMPGVIEAITRYMNTPSHYR